MKNTTTKPKNHQGRKYSAGTQAMLDFLQSIAPAPASRDDLLAAFKCAHANSADKKISKRMCWSLENLMKTQVIVADGGTYALGKAKVPVRAKARDCDALNESPQEKWVGKCASGRLIKPMCGPAYVPTHQPVLRAGATDFARCKSQGHC